ncbi:hypothetical protein NEMIN01_1344 [Nematocida minor]|uniref:uncharacterized protein n=1 Tax=Nematocida minor TaxID=1912983 RepID=UPI002220A24C|nr:uncharacterized protein NEMIN01_1344 [Nematocida minor]KAI5191075.1 hypothetical protein NEMIN01_1344 [Nematocida minor]
MQYFIILTTKGPAVFQRTSHVHGRVLFAGSEYAVPIEDTPLAKDEDKSAAHLQSIVWSAVQVIQAQRSGKALPKKRKLIKVLKMDDTTSGSGRVTTKNKTSVMGILLGTGIAKMFKSSFGKQKTAETNEYLEGEFSTCDEIFKKEKPIEPLIAFEVPDKSEMFQCKFSIVLNDDSETLPLKPQTHQKTLLESTEAANAILKDVQKNFYVGEFAFILGLAKSKICIVEVGRWLFYNDYTEIFSNLLSIIEMLISVFINTTIRSVSSEYITEDINEYMPALRMQDYSQIIYKSAARTEAMQRILDNMKELSDKKLVNAAMATASSSMLTYFEEVSRVIYSPEFIKYIASVEENISKYKKKCKSEIVAAERMFSCNLTFLFVDVYHRIIKYRLYITEAITALKKGSSMKNPDFSGTMGNISTSDEVEGPATPCDFFAKEISFLSDHNIRLTELLKATERFKKIKSLKDSGIIFPDCIDDFIETYELTNGIVIITRDNIVLVNGQHVTSVISKKEIIGCIPASQDTDYPTTHIDLAVTCIYPPSANFVTDVVNHVRVHWIRLNFKWDGNQGRFIDACQCRNVSTIAGLEMRLRDNTVAIEKSLRKRIEKADVKNSHKRMLAIRAQREVVPTADLYTFGQKNKISECLLFKIKEWIDSSLREYADSLSSISVVADPSDLSFERKLFKEVSEIIKYHSPMRKTYNTEKNEFSCVMADPYTLGAGVKVFVEYLSYVYRMLSPQDALTYSTSAMSALTSVHEIRNPALSNDEFLELAIGCSRSLAVPDSLNKNEFLLSLLMVRFFTIAAPDIGLSNYLALLSPLFLFNSQDLVNLPRCASE